MTDNNYIGEIMMKSIKYISLMACVATCLAVASCEKDSQTQANNPGSSNQTFIPLDQLNGHKVNPLGDVMTVSFTSAVEWEADVSGDWLNLGTKSAGAGTTNITFTFQPWFDNDSMGKNRKAVVKFRNPLNNTLLNSVELTQDAGYLRVLNSDGSEVNECSFIWKADSQKLLVESNVEWEVNFTDRLGNVIADGDMPSFTKDILNGVNNGKPGESSEVTVNLSTNAHNFDTDYNEAHLVFTPVKVDLHAREESKRDYARDISVSQDYLIFVVVEGEGSNLSLDYIPEDAFRRDLVLDGFSELGYDFVQTGAVSGDEHITTKDFTLIYEESTVAYNDIKSTDSLLVVKQPGDLKEWNGRDVRFVTFSSTLTKANPECEVKEFEIPLTIEGMEDEEGASRKVTLVQNPYVWDMSVGKLLADDNASTMIIINTTGPWTMEVPELSSWWNTENTEWSGVGSKIITFTSSEWNLDLTEDKTAAFRISNTCNSLADDLTLIKEHYHFNIGENLVTEQLTAREMLATLFKQNTRSYAVEVDCSGEWKAAYERSDWVNIENLDNETSNFGNSTFTLGALTMNTEDDNRDAKIVFTSLTHENKGIPVTDTLYMKQLKHVFGWEPDEWTEEVRNQNCQQPAYITGKDTHTFGFMTKFSDTWSLRSNQEWVKFHLGKNSADKSRELRGNGNSDIESYVYVTVDNNFNTGSSNRTATVTVYDEFKGVSKSFTISQEPFVFNVDFNSQYSVGPFDTGTKNFNMTVTEGAPWTIGVQGTTGLVNVNTKGGTGTGSAQSNSFTTTAVTDVNVNRSATVTVNVADGALSKSFKVSQQAYNFTHTGSRLSMFHEVNYSKQTVTVDCYNNDWTLESGSTDWLTVTKNGNTIELTPKGVNTKTDSSNEATIVISTPFGGNKKSSSFTVRQDKYKFAITDRPSSTSFTPLDVTTKMKVGVQASAGWSTELTGEAKLKVSDKTSSSIYVSPSEANYQTQPKPGKLVLKSDHGHSAEVSFTQEAYVFSVASLTDKTAKPEGETITFSNLKATGDLKAEVVTADATWLTINQQPTTGGVLKINATANSGKDAKVRHAQVKVYSEHVAKNSALAKTITVTQQPQASN